MQLSAGSSIARLVPANLAVEMIRLVKPFLAVLHLRGLGIKKKHVRQNSRVIRLLEHNVGAWISTVRPTRQKIIWARILGGKIVMSMSMKCRKWEAIAGGKNSADML